MATKRKIVSADTLSKTKTKSNGKKSSTKTKKSSNIDLGKLADLVDDNKNVIGRVADELLTDGTSKRRRKKNSKGSLDAADTEGMITMLIRALKSFFKKNK